MLHYENLQLYLRLGLKLRKIHHVLELNKPQWLRQSIDFNTQKRIEAGKNRHKNEKVFHKLINNAIYGKTMENFRFNVKLRKDYLKCTSKPRYMSHKIFDNNLVVIRKNKIVLTLNKLASIMITLKINIATIQHYYLQTLIV